VRRSRKLVDVIWSVCPFGVLPSGYAAETNGLVFTNRSAVDFPEAALSLRPIERYEQELLKHQGVVADRFGPPSYLDWTRFYSREGYSIHDHVNSLGANAVGHLIGDSMRETAVAILPLEEWKGFGQLLLGYDGLGRHSEALLLREETLKLRKAKLGPDHPDTLKSMNDLAYSYYTVGRHPEAMTLLEETLKLRKDKLGANHPDTADTIYSIACMHALMIAKAEDRGKQADLAMDWLQQAVAAGYKDAAHMKKDTDLDPLRDREEFKKLIAEMEARVEKK
jgi:tetratricopeptide (TPR) repeat protein